MAYWLVKTEPFQYNYSDLEKRGVDHWDGVKNFAALKHLRKMVPGDLVFIYHTGKEKAVFGVAQIVSFPYPNPEEKDDRLVVVNLSARYRLPRPVTLAEIKERHEFAGWELVRLPRLSVMPVTFEHWNLVHELSEKTITTFTLAKYPTRYTNKPISRKK